MTKIPLKPKNDQNTPEESLNNQNILKTQKMTKIPPKPKKEQNTPET